MTSLIQFSTSHSPVQVILGGQHAGNCLNDCTGQGMEGCRLDRHNPINQHQIKSIRLLSSYNQYSIVYNNRIWNCIIHIEKCFVLLYFFLYKHRDMTTRGINDLLLSFIVR